MNLTFCVKYFDFIDFLSTLPPDITTKMNIDTKISLYLERIGYNDNVEVSLKCLRKLQECHQSRVPFENLDVFTGRKKVLDNEILFEQIVIKRRGGWCHELNGLFCWLRKAPEPAKL